MSAVKRLVRGTPLALPARRLVGWLADRRRARSRRVRFGSLRRLTPLSTEFGYDRGQPVDRCYIERFLANNAADVRGRVLEIADDNYTRRFGGRRVTVSDVLHARDQAPGVTIVGDLATGENVPSDAFDCLIVTQTLQVIYDVAGAVATIHRALRPGGVALVSVPGISPVSRYDMERWGHYWSFTTASAKRLFEAHFRPGNVAVEAHGNVLAVTAFLYGLASEELRPAELDHHDPDYQLVITIRAVKAES